MAPASESKKETASKKSEKKGGLHIADTVQSLADSVRKELNKRIGGSGRKAKTRGADLAVTLIKLQRSAFDKAFKIVTRVQEGADKVVKEHVEDASWLPGEGKDIVKEWSRTLSDGRAEFQKTVDKSYDLLRGYFERVKKEQKSAGKKTSVPRSKVPSKKKTAARKAVASKPKPAPETNTTTM